MTRGATSDASPVRIPAMPLSADTRLDDASAFRGKRLAREYTSAAERGVVRSARRLCSSAMCPRSLVS
jgi:hypothetical protein